MIGIELSLSLVVVDQSTGCPNRFWIKHDIVFTHQFNFIIEQKIAKESLKSAVSIISTNQIDIFHKIRIKLAN